MNDGEIAKKINEIFDMKPAAIVKRFGLKNPIFKATASYGHVGRTPYTQKVAFGRNGSGDEKEIEFFAWEKLDYVEKIKQSFAL
jgi:S-adenosylmethionine synthetase